MVKKYPTILKLPQREINRQLYEMILTKLSDSGLARLENLIKSIGYTTSMLQRIIGNEETLGSVLYRIHQLELKNGIKTEPKPDNSEPENKEPETKEPENKKE